MKCRLCSKQYTPVISFGQMPIANAFLNQEQFNQEYFFELATAFCPTCKMFQLIDQPDPKMMFHDHYAFFSSTSKKMAEHFEKISELKTAEAIEAFEKVELPVVVFEDVDTNLENQPSKTIEEPVLEVPRTALLQKPTQILANALEEFFPSKGKINFNEMLETLPTFSTQTTASKQVFELNDVMLENEESLNDVFKTPVVEVAQAIKEAPVKDLRKAIGVNDKYLFINELFKGDEAMYDKCIKTINSFSVYPEAETWIRRELLVKMGWDEKGIATKQFYNIVMRRFS